MEIAIAAVGILVVGLVVMAMIAVTPAGTERATRAIGDSPELEADTREAREGV